MQNIIAYYPNDIIFKFSSIWKSNLVAKMTQDGEINVYITKMHFYQLVLCCRRDTKAVYSAML